MKDNSVVLFMLFILFLVGMIVYVAVATPKSNVSNKQLDELSAQVEVLTSAVYAIQSAVIDLQKRELVRRTGHAATVYMDDNPKDPNSAGYICGKKDCPCAPRQNETPYAVKAVPLKMKTTEDIYRGLGIFSQKPPGFQSGDE